MKHSILIIFFSLFIVSHLQAADFKLKVTDARGNTVADAAAALKNETIAETAPAQKTVEINQKDKEFTPRVTLIQAGTSVEFPNHDTVQHHVYSFSQPKRFDIPLYKEEKPKPVLFDKPGVVVIGCNIHDWMKAYIYVTDTPYFSKSAADGVIHISNIPSGKYKLTFWHPRLKKILGKGLPESIDLDEKKNFSEAVSVDVSVELKKEIVPSKNVIGGQGGY